VSARFQDLVAAGKLRLERARARWAAVDVGVRTLKRYSEDDGGSYAAALTYYTFLSIFPLLVFAVAALGYITFGDTDLRRDILESGVEAVPLLSDILTAERLRAIEQARGRLALTGVVVALYSGSGAVVALEHGLNKVFHVVQEPNFIAKRLRSLRWLAVLGAAAIASLGLSAAAELAGAIFESLASFGSVAAPLMLHAGGAAVGVAVFATAYKFLPAATLTWRDVLPGALAAGVAFEMLKLVGAAYLRAGNQGRAATFGAFATAAGLLIASYLLSQIALLCAELNAVLAERRITRQSQVSLSQGGDA
jgi:membrane protein